MKVYTTPKKNIQGNISVIVMFILAIISLLALAGAHHVQHIIQLNRQTVTYYQAYYLAQAGIEVGNTLTQNHGPGFQASISGSTLYTLPCTGGNTCERHMNIHSRVPYEEQYTYFLTQGDQERICTSDTAIQLLPGETWSVPLFVDDASWTGNTQTQNRSLLSSDLDIELISPNSLAQPVALAIATPDGISELIQRHKRYMTGTTNTVSIKDFLHNLHVNTLLTGEIIQNNRLTYVVGNQTILLRPLSSTLSPFHNYLLVSNPQSTTNGQELSFCIEVNNEKSRIPRSTIRITSQGSIRDTTVSLKALRKEQLPDFVFSTFLER